VLKPGKQFEADFQKSIPQGYYWYRLKDCPSGWTASAPGGQEPLRRFTPRNGYDLFMFAEGALFTLELKSVKDPRFPLSNMTDLQEQELARAHAHPGIWSGLVINFREEEETYLVPITTVWRVRTEGVKSINLATAQRDGILIPQRKLKVHYRYDIESAAQVAASGLLYGPGE
jgi:penicillin-binding protein-related factor A (putative recombinase)